MLGEDIVQAKYMRSIALERRAAGIANRVRLRALPGWLPVARRPRCPRCKKPMPLYPFSSGRATYGFKGEGHFCSFACGYWFGVDHLPKR